MEGLPINVSRAVIHYRRTRGYERLGEQAPAGWRLSRFRFRVKPRLKLLVRLASAKKLFVWLRDAYVRMMLGFADSRVLGAGYGGNPVIDAFGRAPRKDYDPRVIAEIYRSLVAAREAGIRGSVIAHRQLPSVERTKMDISC